MKIELMTTYSTKFATVYSWNAANEAMKAIWNRNYWSDVRYKITFDDLETVTGTIDIEPHSFFAPVKRSILTTHLKTFWTNMSKSTSFGISPDDNFYFANLLKYLP